MQNEAIFRIGRQILTYLHILFLFSLCLPPEWYTGKKQVDEKYVFLGDVW